MPESTAVLHEGSAGWEAPVPGTLALRELPVAVAELRLWWWNLDQPLSFDAGAWLNEAENARAVRFVFAQDQHRYRVGRAGLRQVLGRLAGRSPADVVLDVMSAGKPVLAQPAGLCHFNLSHSGAVALLGVSHRWPVGVDLEQLRELPDAPGVAAEMFTAEEQAEWAALPLPLKTRAFMRLWTRKEACLKAWGVGLSLDPRSLGVGLADGGQLIEPPDPLLGGPLWVGSLSLPDNPDFEVAVALGTAGSTRHAKESLPESECRPTSSVPPSGGSLPPITRP